MSDGVVQSVSADATFVATAVETEPVEFTPRGGPGRSTAGCADTGAPPGGGARWTVAGAGDWFDRTPSGYSPVVGVGSKHDASRSVVSAAGASGSSSGGGHDDGPPGIIPLSNKRRRSRANGVINRRRDRSTARYFDGEAVRSCLCVELNGSRKRGAPPNLMIELLGGECAAC